MDELAAEQMSFLRWQFGVSDVLPDDGKASFGSDRLLLEVQEST